MILILANLPRSYYTTRIRTVRYKPGSGLYNKSG